MLNSAILLRFVGMRLVTFKVFQSFFLSQSDFSAALRRHLLHASNKIRCFVVMLIKVVGWQKVIPLPKALALSAQWLGELS